MKKTLFALAALTFVPVAYAVDYTMIRDYEVGDFTTAWEGSYAYGSLTLPFTLDFSKDFEISATITIGEGGVNEHGSPLFSTRPNAYQGSSAEGGLRIWMDTSNKLYTSFDGDTYGGATANGYEATTFDTLAVGSVLTFTYTYTAATKYGKAIIKVGEKSDTRYATFDGTDTITSLSTGVGFHNATEAKEWDIRVTVKGTAAPPPSGEAIPEPATATLSLLALAGLAARRRRK